MLNRGSPFHANPWSCFIPQNPGIFGVGNDLWRSLRIFHGKWKCPRAGDTGTNPRGFGMTPERNNPKSPLPVEQLHGEKMSLTLRRNSWRFGIWDEWDPGHQTRSQSPTGSAGSGHSSPAIPVNTSRRVWEHSGLMLGLGILQGQENKSWHQGAARSSLEKLRRIPQNPAQPRF